MNEFKGKNILILPHSALGDLTIYIRLARNFYDAGARVTVCSDLLLTASDLFSWIKIKPSVGKSELEIKITNYDLVFAYYGLFSADDLRANDFENVAYVAAKKTPRSVPEAKRSVVMGGIEYKQATRAFCTDSKLSLTMVQWVDEYCSTVFGIKPSAIKPEVFISDKEARRVLIFPVSPHEKKNYWLGGFKYIASRLVRNGWDVKFVCAPNEVDMLKPRLNNYELVTFTSAGELLSYIARSKAVISNDSGGGHFASLCGVETYTFTRRGVGFVWRPGFFINNVISPYFRFKLFGNYVWRPFVPFWKVVQGLGRYE